MNTPSSSYRYPIRGGFLFGTLAFLAGYALTFHFLSLGPDISVGVDTSNTTVAGWYYYGAHNVPLGASVSVVENTATQTANPLIQTPFSPYSSFLWVIPAIVLIFGGVLVSVGFGQTPNLTYSVANGTSVAIGYGISSLIASFVFSHSVSGFLGMSATIQPALGQTFLYMVVVYPIIFGAVGGLIYFFSQGNVSITVRSG